MMMITSKDCSTKLTLSLAIFIFAVAASAASANSADTLVKLADDHRFPNGDVSFSVTITDMKKNEKVRDSEYKVVSDGKGRSLVETTKPDRQRGRKLLMVDSDLWLFSPNIKRPVRVSVQQKMTGEVSNGDLANTNYSGDYYATETGREKIDGRDTVKLRLKAKSKTATYAAIDYWLDAKTSAPVRAHFLTSSGKLMKVGTFEKYGPVLGKQRLVRLRVEDALNRNSASIMDYSSFKKEKLDDSVFSKESMSR